MTVKNYGSTYWRSLESLNGDEKATRHLEGEFLPGAAEELEVDGVSRRRFMGILGAGAALAGATSTGCARKPSEKILPFSSRPEDLVPGKPLHYASAYQLGGTVLGLVVETHDGRPTKVDGNPNHSNSQGSSSVWAQASVLDLYDPERSTVARKGDAEISKDDAQKALVDAVKAASGGKGLAVVVRYNMSPSVAAQLRTLKKNLPSAQVFVSDPSAPVNADAAAELIGGKGARARIDLDKAKVILAADSDFLGVDTDHVRHSRAWSKNRKVDGPKSDMSRLYVAESHLTGTGTMADHRLRVRSSEAGDLLLAVAAELKKSHGAAIQVPSGADGVLSQAAQLKLDENGQKFVTVVAKDLAENAGKSAILVGDRQPAWVHGLAFALNAALRNQGSSLRWRMDADAVETGSLADLAKGLESGQVSTVVCLDTNPAYEAAGGLGMEGLLAKANVIHAGLYRDETGKLAKVHMPVSHYLEAWGDLQSSDGTVSLQQPMIAPLHDTFSVLELLNLVASGNFVDGYSLLKGTWQQAATGGAFSDRAWRKWLHDGVVTGISRPPNLPTLSGWGKISDAMKGRATPGAWEVDVRVCPKVWDGRFSNNGWCQELPHPMTKLTWDNAACLSASTAEELGVKNGDMVQVSLEGGGSVELPVWIAPGQAPKVVTVTLGYGRKELGAVAEGAGFDVRPLQGSANPWFGAGNVSAASGTYELVSTQDYGSMKPPVHAGFDYPERPLVIEATREEFAKDPDFVEAANLMPESRLRHLWDPPALTGKQQWGMVIDLNSCSGCNACVTACQSENNIPVVGKEVVANGREMHWIRIDRYYRGDVDNPTAVVQPVACVQCESAPCETVCPVAATTHSPEGLNDMAYNRCIGTRYCSNNCPYKVRRFNFFNYNTDINPLHQMQKNPDVTIRFRGVMEKCTYCTQRISQAKIAAHVKGEDVVADGAIVTACEQACPTQAITFGDIKDPESRVSKLKKQERDYVLLRDLNTGPRTSYLARIRNPHPELA